MNNNPHYSDVSVNNNALQRLPMDAVPSNLLTVKSDNEIVPDYISKPDVGPPGKNLEEESIHDQTNETSSFLPVAQQQQQEIDAIKDQLSVNKTLAWPTIGDKPLNEYQTPFLATMAFPTLFPDGKGDSNNPSLVRNVSL